MKNNRCALILLLTLALARAASAADAVSLITGGTVTEDTAVWTAFSRSALDTVVSPYQPNPDAEVNRLSLTLPSWTDSIIRVHKGTDFETVSLASMHQLENALSTHQEAVTLMLTDVRKEDKRDDD